jgi:DNA replication protein DnaC
MLDSKTVVKMHDLHLGAMAKEFERQSADPACSKLSFEDRMAMIVDLEWGRRFDARVARSLKKARLGIPDACIENILYFPDRGLDKNLFTKLSSCSYIADKRNVCFFGASGAGKTYLACALGNAACRSTLSVAYIRLPELLDELAVARAENNFRAVISRYKKVRLLVLDEWMLHSLKVSEARDLLEIVEARNAAGASIVFCSQFDPQGWFDKISDPTVADAVVDRIAHNSYKVFIKGEDSMRKRLGLDSAEA